MIGKNFNCKILAMSESQVSIKVRFNPGAPIYWINISRVLNELAEEKMCKQDLNTLIENTFNNGAFDELQTFDVFQRDQTHCREFFIVKK